MGWGIKVTRGGYARNGLSPARRRTGSFLGASGETRMGHGVLCGHREVGVVSENSWGGVIRAAVEGCNDQRAEIAKGDIGIDSEPYKDVRKPAVGQGRAGKHQETIAHQGEICRIPWEICLHCSHLDQVLTFHAADSSNVSRREAVKEYLESTVVPVLSRALTDMCVQVEPKLVCSTVYLRRQQPEDPFKWLARWLIENHPTSPQQAEWCETLVHKLAQGDFFGEIALLSGKPRQATVKESYKSIEIPEANTDDAKEQNGPEEENEDDEPPTPPPVNVRSKSMCRGRRGTVFVEAAQIEDGWTPPSYPKSEDEIHRLDEHISKTALLAYLDPKARTTVIEAFEKKNFSAGEDIIRQGDDGDYYYILDAGKADVSIRMLQHSYDAVCMKVLLAKPLGSEPFKVNEYGPGGSFGELALLHGEPRNATIRTTESCVTWALDRDTFRKIMMQSGKQDMNDRLQFLSKVSLLAELTQYEKFKIAEAMKASFFWKEMSEMSSSLFKAET
eukprot:750659-Hanusia_phi.AAC.1